jgi:hypothetical protein
MSIVSFRTENNDLFNRAEGLPIIINSACFLRLTVGIMKTGLFEKGGFAAGIHILMRLRFFRGMALFVVVVSSSVQPRLCAMSNAAGGLVQAISSTVDSSAPILTNPAGARVALAGTDHTSSNQLNNANAIVYIGLFDPVEHAIPTPTPTPLPLPETVLFEDWNNGTINPGIWKTSIQTSEGGGRLELKNLGGGDYAIFFQGPPGSNGSDHTTWLYSLNNFTRGQDLRVTFTIWCDPTDSYDWTGGQPIYAAVHGPWHTDNTSPVYSNPEAMIRYWATRYFAQPGDPWPTGGTAMTDFDTALENATSKAGAIRVRVWLGDIRGAKIEWADSSGQWTTVIDNRGVGNGTGSPYLGWGTYATAVLIDDIHVQITGTGCQDQDPPVIIQCTEPVNIPLDSGCQAVVPDLTDSLQVSDDCSTPGQLLLTQDPLPGTLVGPGPVDVIINARDATGKTSQCSVSVNAVDTTPPQIICAGDITAECAGPAGAQVNLPAHTATDNCSGVAVQCDFNSGDLFPVGTTVVTCTATDSSGNISQCTHQVVVQDSSAPVTICPPPINTSWTRPDGAVVDVPATAGDLCDPAPAVLCFPDPASTVFSVNSQTQVTCFGIDTNLNFSPCNTSVTVTDDVPLGILEINGEHPDNDLVITTGQVDLTFSMFPGSATDPADWYFGFVANSQLQWITSAGISSTPAPLSQLPMVSITEFPLLDLALPDGTVISFVSILADPTSFDLLHLNFISTFVANPASPSSSGADETAGDPGEELTEKLIIRALEGLPGEAGRIDR